jgi:hypothetical protein
MKKEAIFTIVLLIILIALGLGAHYFTKPSATEINNSSSLECAKAGERSNSGPVSPPYQWQKQCCSGLVEISNCASYESNRSDADSQGCVYRVGCGNICSACGNNICESWENKCNCPSDCK